MSRECGFPFRDVCEGDTVIRAFYGDGVRFAKGWWGNCAECGALVAVKGMGGEDLPAVHLRAIPGPSGPFRGVGT